jgi:hypothetical protein
MGLFADIPFLKGETVLNYALFPDIWYECQYTDLSEEKRKKRCYIMINNEKCITTDKKTKFSYVNHCREANCNYDFKNRLLKASRLIYPNEEITIDYRTEPLPNGENFPDWI